MKIMRYASGDVIFLAKPYDIPPKNVIPYHEILSSSGMVMLST